VCDLPKGFTYKIISQQGEVMSDGHKVLGYHDGMGCFSGPNDEIILVIINNNENTKKLKLNIFKD